MSVVRALPEAIRRQIEAIEDEEPAHPLDPRTEAMIELILACVERQQGER